MLRSKHVKRMRVFAGPNGSSSVTFAETRLSKVRHKERKSQPQPDIPLTPGSPLLIGETMQDHYEHHMPKKSRKIMPRINLTFRIAGEM